MAQVAVLAATAAISIAQQRAQARAQQRQRQAALDQQVSVEQERQRIRNEQKREAQSRDEASVRAGFGARGVSSVSGSAGALLDGIAERTDRSIAADQRMADLGLDKLRENNRRADRQDMLETRNSILNTVVGTGGKLLSGP